MTLRGLIALLQWAGADSVVWFLDDYADLTEADELFNVAISEHAWTRERGSSGG